jgi:hypothetical protein
MEILIPGLILVALMVYASTKIKRSAAAAFDAETIETDDYVIQKPGGFLNNLNGDPAYLFESYSKEFGEDAPGVRMGTVTIAAVPGSPDTVAAGAAADETLVDQVKEVIGGRTYHLVESTVSEEDDNVIHVTRKIAGKGGQSYILTARRLAESSAEFTAKMEAFVAGFELK